LPFEAIIEHNNEKIKSDAIEHYSTTIDRLVIFPRNYLWDSKNRATTDTKFGSKTEKDFSTILENDTAGLKMAQTSTEAVQKFTGNIIPVSMNPISG